MDKNDILSVDKIEALGITENQITILRHEAEAHGDDRMFSTCNSALRTTLGCGNLRQGDSGCVSHAGLTPARGGA